MNFIQLLWALEACLYDCSAHGQNPLLCKERKMSIENCPIEWTADETRDSNGARFVGGRP